MTKTMTMTTTMNSLFRRAPSFFLNRTSSLFMTRYCFRGTVSSAFSTSIIPRPRFRQRLPSGRSMTTAYQGEPGDGTMGLSELSYIPYTHTLKNGQKIQVGPFLSTEWSAGMELMNLIIREGNSWPFDKEFETIDSYRGYFLSHAAFAVRALDDGTDSHGNTLSAGDLLGCFYIKPNYPGRCSHICNGGFITAPHVRRTGVARLMGTLFLRIANDLGYKSAYFNLVFRSNHASVALWESLGFQRVAVLEHAAKLKGVEGLDTAYGYRYDLSNFDKEIFVPRNNTAK